MISIAQKVLIQLAYGQVDEWPNLLFVFDFFKSTTENDRVSSTVIYVINKRMIDVEFHKFRCT